MKAFKLASAFAVTGLALAVSGQAMAADTTTDWTWDGEVTVKSVLMDGNSNGMGTGANDVLASAGDRGVTSLTGPKTNLDVVVDVANGGFAAKLKLEGSSVVTSDFTYTEGAFMFGEIGSVVTTEGAITGMDDDQAWTSDAGFRYTSGGLQVQAFAGETCTDDICTTTDTSFIGSVANVDMGLEFAYSGSTDTVSYTVDAQYAEDGSSMTDEALDAYMGVYVSAMASDSVTVEAGYTGAGDLTSTALQASYAADAITAYGRYNQDNAADAVFTLGGTYTMGAVVASAKHVLDGETTLGLAYSTTSGAMTFGANAETKLDASTTSFGADVAVAASDMLAYTAGYMSRHDETTRMAAGVAYTTEGGAVLALDYTNDDGGDDDYDIENSLIASASYKF